MIQKTRTKFWLAVATHIGFTVGVGLYGIPFAFQKSGFGVGLFFLIGLTLLVFLANLLYGEMILRTHERHQYVGYVDKYLSPWARKVNLFIFWVAVYGGLVGVTVIAGEFLSIVFSPLIIISPAGFSGLFTAFAAILIFRGLRTVSKIDLTVLFFYLAIIITLGILGAGHISPSNYKIIAGDFWFLPFGVVLFAMSSIMGISLVREVLTGNEELLKKTLTFGTFIPAVFYLLFALLVVGVSGEATTPDAISGLLGALGPNVVWMGSLFGLITSSTLFLNLSTALKESFQEDFRFRHRWAWFLAVLPPYLLFLTGVRNFIDIISLVGGVGIGMKMFFSVWVHVQAKKHGDRIPEYSVRLPRPVLLLIMFVFLAGAVYTILVK
ncbi:MAG: hypothetical protein HY506_02125 [Candidatus Yanofskybacteria bacterium]|nr:hypothetical protein [Candidatus Yanofskybacteria bacterium]